MWCDTQVSPEALPVSVLMQPKTSSDAHLTPCACHKAGQGQPLPGTASAAFAWTKSTSLSHFFQPQLPELLSQFWGQPDWNHAHPVLPQTVPALTQTAAESEEDHCFQHKPIPWTSKPLLSSSGQYWQMEQLKRHPVCPDHNHGKQWLYHCQLLFSREMTLHHWKP